MAVIYLIVEGHGEVQALPVLIRKILHEDLGRYDSNIDRPYRMPRSKICRFSDDLSVAVRLGGFKITEVDEGGGVLILVDSDDDCPMDLHAKFEAFCAQEAFDIPVAMIAANREYEAWFIACGESLRGRHSVRHDAVDHPAPETVRGAKEFFQNEILVRGANYSETLDQEKYSAIIDIHKVYLACRSLESFILRSTDCQCQSNSSCGQRLPVG